MIEVILAVIFFICGWIAREAYARYLINKMMKKVSDVMIENLEKSIIDITVEKHKDMFLVYQKDDGVFLAQGKDIHELSDVLMEKYPGKFFNASSEIMEMLVKE
jgi:hypothetical protein